MILRNALEDVLDIPNAVGGWDVLEGTAKIYDKWGMHEEAEFYRAGLPEWRGEG